MRRGEIWLVNLDPTIGSEIRKMSSDEETTESVRLSGAVSPYVEMFFVHTWPRFQAPAPVRPELTVKAGGSSAGCAAEVM